MLPSNSHPIFTKSRLAQYAQNVSVPSNKIFLLSSLDVGIWKAYSECIEFWKLGECCESRKIYGHAVLAI